LCQSSFKDFSAFNRKDGTSILEGGAFNSEDEYFVGRVKHFLRRAALLNIEIGLSMGKIGLLIEI
jgi:hypothetical protein